MNIIIQTQVELSKSFKIIINTSIDISQLKKFRAIFFASYGSIINNTDYFCNTFRYCKINYKIFIKKQTLTMTEVESDMTPLSVC